MIGHGIRECSVDGDIKEVTSEANYHLCMWLRTVSPSKKSQGRFRQTENYTRSRFMGVTPAKVTQSNYRRLQDNWRKPYDHISVGNSGDRKGITHKTTGLEKGKGLLDPMKSCIKNCAVDGNIISREKENGNAMKIDGGGSNEEDNTVGILGCMGRNIKKVGNDEVEHFSAKGTEPSGKLNKDLGLVKPISEVLDSTQSSKKPACLNESYKVKRLDQPKAEGSCLTNNTSYKWRRVGRTSNSAEKQTLSGIELGKRNGDNHSTNLRYAKKKARVSKVDDVGDQRLETGEDGSIKDSQGSRSLEHPEGRDSHKVLYMKDGICEELEQRNEEDLLSVRDLEILCVTLLKVWMTRNDWVHNRKKSDVSNVVWWSRNYIDEQHRISGKMVPTKSKVGDRWSPPDQGLLKVNCSAAMDKRRRRIGLGTVIRDSEGRVMACCSQVCDANFDLETAKAMAVYKGLKFWDDCGLGSCIVETDSFAVINNINKGGLLDSRYGSLLDSIALLASNSRGVAFNCVCQVQ
ncbi:hypothetical protein LWI29_010038 [Acer saccharum]|uniref:RNase H type-1 domain-containing protein n=1 Tax=Acer saccharum TaxID=4024 RepID=A0AA39W6X4_ACESA|nr:hypothetical protein LWI29_010038 [Acer saccharum]